MNEEKPQNFVGLSPQYQAYIRQKCFVAYSTQAEWADDLLSACQEVLCRPEFNLELDYAGKYFDPNVTLREKAIELISNARYGIYDLSYWRNEKGMWQMPRNVLIELGMAIALNRPTLLLRHASNRDQELPECLKSLSGHILEFSGESTLKRLLETRLPDWVNTPPDRDWWNRYCIFGNKICEYRETHPRAKQWGQKTLHCHISDGPDIDRLDFRIIIENVLGRFSDVTFSYLEKLSIIENYDFLLCSHCQTVRSTPFAIYRITPNTSVETFIAIGMSIALERQFEYKISKILLTEKIQDIPSLLSGYEVVVAQSDTDRKARLRSFIPGVIQKVRETEWKPRPLPFIEFISDAIEPLNEEKEEDERILGYVLAAYEEGEIIRGRCIRRITGGLVVDIMGLEAYLPSSQIDVNPIRDFDVYIGQMMDFRVVKVNELRKNIVVSHRVLVEEAMSEQRGRILENLAKGQVLEGTVKNITDFGVFIDLGGVDGLLHTNDLSWGRVSHPSEIVSLDEKIKVQVLDFNEAKDRISLGLKQLQPHPWVDVDKKYPMGTVVRGKVVSISDYGAFVELERGIEGLIHISEMSWTQHIRHPSKIVSVGEMVYAKVLNIDLEERKISLGLKQLEPDPWDDIEQKYPIGSHQKGVVRNLTNFGAFVELEDGIDGLVHISDLSWTKKIRHPGEVVKKGDEVDVVVLNVDKYHRRISLGYKQVKVNPWGTFENEYKVHTKTAGKIVRMIDKGVVVELPAEVDGFVPMSHLAKPNLTKPADGYAVGDTLELVVIEFNKDSKKIILSERLSK